MDVNHEYIDPFNNKFDYFMRVEHLARYFFASDLMGGFKNVLDIACANGYGTKLLSEKAIKVIGIDKNEQYIEEAKMKNNNSNISYKKLDADFEKIEGNFDGIVCFETIEHVQNPKAVLTTLFSVLNDEGTMILSFPNDKYEIIENGINKDEFHLHVFKLKEMIQMLKEIGFNIQKINGQSYINKIVNNEIEYSGENDLIKDAKTIGYPNEEELDKTYSYILVLNKEQR